MKKFLLKKIVWFISIVSFVFAQENEKTVLIDAYYGGITLSNIIIKAITNNSSAKAHFIGPTGIRFEYKFSKVVGIGVDGQYNLTTVSWNNVVESNGIQKTYYHKVEWQRIRIMPKISFHFGESEKFDGYASIMIGGIISDFTHKTNDPYDLGIKANWPSFAFRICIGGRYFFTKNFGLFGEVGTFGGGLIHGGLTFRF